MLPLGFAAQASAQGVPVGGDTQRNFLWHAGGAQPKQIGVGPAYSSMPRPVLGDMGYAKDGSDQYIPDPKNPRDSADLRQIYQASKSGALFSDPSAALLFRYAQLGDPLLLVSVEADCGGRRSGGSGPIECRALPANGSLSIAGVSADRPALPNQPRFLGQAGADGELYHPLLDRGSQVVTDPLTGETATIAELYGDVAILGLDPDGNPIPSGQSVTGFGGRLEGSSVTLPQRLAASVAELVGINATCSTNRADTRDPHAVDNLGNFEFDAATRQQIIGSGREGACPDNRPDSVSVDFPISSPAAGLLAVDPGPDGELGENPDYADRAEAVIDPNLESDVDAILQQFGFPSVADGGLSGVGSTDVAGFHAEQSILNELTPFFRGVARANDDSSFGVLDPKRPNPFRGRETPTMVARANDVPGVAQSARANGDRATLLPNDAETEGVPGEEVDDAAERLDELLSLAGAAGLRMRRARVSPSGRGVPSQVRVGPFPNGVLRRPSTTVRRGPLQIGLLQRDGASFGGDFSGKVACLTPRLVMSRTGPPQFGTADASLAGFSFEMGCVPFTNVAAVGGAGERPLRPAPDLASAAGSIAGSAQGIVYPPPFAAGRFERNVDPATGRLRKSGASGLCENAAGFADREPDRGGAPATTYRVFHAGNRRLAQEFDLGARRPLLAPQGDPTALPTGADTADPLDDYVKHPVAYTPHGIGIDPACLKPGGGPGPNENRFGSSFAPTQPLERVQNDPFTGIDADGDGVLEFFLYSRSGPALDFATTTLGQWELEGASVDAALTHHPADLTLFARLCSAGTPLLPQVDGDSCGLDAAASNHVPAPVDLPVSEILPVLLAGERGTRLETVIARGYPPPLVPLAPLNRDARDGLTTAVADWVTGDDPFNPGDLGDLLTMGNTLSIEQQALYGCGPLFGTRCDSADFYNADVDFIEALFENRPARAGPPARPEFGANPPLEFPGQTGGGIDLSGTEASAALEAFPGAYGTGEVLGMYTVLIGSGGELSRLGADPTLDLRDFGFAEQLLDCAQGRCDKLRVPVAYRSEYEYFLALQEGLELLESNPSGTAFGAPSCPIVVNGIVDNSCAGLEQIVERISVLQATGDIGRGGANEAEYDELTRDGGQFDRQVATIGNQADGAAVDSQFGRIRNQSGDLGSISRDILETFREGGNDPGNPGNEDRSGFGRTREQVDAQDMPIRQPLEGAIVPGLEEFGPVSGWVSWSDGPQPGTLGRPGLVEITREFVIDGSGLPVLDSITGRLQTEVTHAVVLRQAEPHLGSPVCMRHEPQSPFADAQGNVRLAGCRGALSLSVNTVPPPLFRGAGGQLLDSRYGTNVYNFTAEQQYAGTVEVVFEDFFDPRVDGCPFGPTVAAGGQVYKVQAVNADASLDDHTQAVLEATCFNAGLEGVFATTSSPGAPFEDFRVIDPQNDLDPFGNPVLVLATDGTTAFDASTSRRSEDPLGEYMSRLVPSAFAGTLFHPIAGCTQASALFGASTSGVLLSGSTTSSPWAVDGATPAGEQMGADFVIVPDEDGNFQVDAGVSANVPRERSPADSRARALCDVRTRDYQNDFLEGAIGQDMNGDGLVAGGAHVFRSETAAWSFNFLQLLTIGSCDATLGDDVTASDCFDASEPWALNRCSFSQPQLCRNVASALELTLDEDRDGISETVDNCTRVGNSIQGDYDADGFGNGCDCDFDNDLDCDDDDAAALMSCFGLPAGIVCAAFDMNEDGLVGQPDYSAFLAGYGNGPGPSARVIGGGNAESESEQGTAGTQVPALPLGGLVVLGAALLTTGARRLRPRP